MATKSAKLNSVMNQNACKRDAKKCSSFEKRAHKRAHKCKSRELNAVYILDPRFGMNKQAKKKKPRCIKMLLNDERGVACANTREYATHPVKLLIVLCISR